MARVRTLTRPRLVRLAAPLAAGVLVLTACGGDDTSADPPEETTPADTAAETADADVTPEGTQLAFGDTATVAPDPEDTEALLDLTVLSAKQGALKDFAGFDMKDPYRKNAHYYYVRVEVGNAGEEPVAGGEVPLWGVSGENTLLPVVKFTSAFKKCPTDEMPESFAPGDTLRTCLVYLSPNKGSLEGLSFRPTEEYVPIEWHGEVEPLPTKKGKKKNN